MYFFIKNKKTIVHCVTGYIYIYVNNKKKTVVYDVTEQFSTDCCKYESSYFIDTK